MTLPLIPFGAASSWGSLLRADELCALDDDDLNRRFCGQLMRELSHDIVGRPPQPNELYTVRGNLAQGQIELLDGMTQQENEQQSRLAQLRSFWAVTLPAALDRSFPEVDGS